MRTESLPQDVLPASPLTGLVALYLGWVAASGCQSEHYQLGKTIPVSGRILVKGKPLQLPSGTFGKVWFHPDPTKGNKCPQIPFGVIDAEGKYELTTRATEGAPPGWYKVMLIATEQIDPSEPRKRRKSLIHPSYGSIETSGLVVQVLEESPPDGYDLKLNR